MHYSVLSVVLLGGASVSAAVWILLQSGGLNASVDQPTKDKILTTPTYSTFIVYSLNLHRFVCIHFYGICT